MALRLSKRKKPRREDKQLKQRMKISERALDDATLETLYYFLNHHDIDSVDYPVAQGKEAIVYRGTIYNKDKLTKIRSRDEEGKTSAESYVAVKVFKYETTSFHDKTPYIEGDTRFVIKKGIRSFVNEWTRKEYANLRLAFDAGVKVPEVFRHRKNVLLMEFMGEGGLPYAKLNEVIIADSPKMLETLIEYLRLMYQKAELVHADFNPYNILVGKNEQPILIDFAQGVKLEHPQSEAYLVRDVHEILEFFSHRQHVYIDEKAVLAWVKGEINRKPKIQANP